MKEPEVFERPAVFKFVKKQLELRHSYALKGFVFKGAYRILGFESTHNPEEVNETTATAQPCSIPCRNQ